MRYLTIEYSHEFISNKIKDELLLNDIWDFSIIEKKILHDIKTFFDFDIGISRDINTLSGGQRSITYLVTLSYILISKKINHMTLNLNNITQSLSPLSRDKILKYLSNKGIYVTE